MDDAAYDRLERLLRAHGPSSREREAADLWAELAGEFATVERDRMGSAIATVGPADAPAVLLLGHIDQIGLIVTHIEDSGVLRVRGLGGWDPRVLVGQPVRVRTQGGDLPGVLGSVPIHLQKGDERTSGTEMKQLWIDIGATDGDHARSLVRIGDDAIVGHEPTRLAGSRLTSRALDDRLGAWVALEHAARGRDPHPRRARGGDAQRLEGDPRAEAVVEGAGREAAAGQPRRLVPDDRVV
ncbi:MAG: hypothetical protein ACKOSO_01490, partial [Actinomycetota bacterium]